MKRAVLFVVKQLYVPIDGHSNIGKPIVVVVSCGAPDTVHAGIQAGLLSDIFESSVTEIVKQRHPALRTVVRQENVEFAIIVIVEKTGARS